MGSHLREAEERIPLQRSDNAVEEGPAPAVALVVLAGRREELRLLRLALAAGERLIAEVKHSLDTGTSFDVWSYPLFERVVDASSQASRRRIHASRPDDVHA